jgi:putative cell wall-binding protein
MGVGLAGVVGFAGPASALPYPTPGATPVSAVTGAPPNTISTIGPFLDAIPAGSSGSAADWAFQLNDLTGTPPTYSDSPTNTVWQVGDQIVIDVGAPGPSGGHNNDFSSGSYVEFDGTPIVVAASGGCSGTPGSTAPTFSTALGERGGDNSSDTGLSDELTITLTNAGDGGCVNPYVVAIAGIKYTVGPNTPAGPISTVGTYITAHAPNVTLSVVPNAEILDAVASANIPPVTVLPSAINAPISPITATELGTGVVPTGYICVTLLPGEGKFVGSPNLTVSGSPTGGTASVSGDVAIINGGQSIVGLVTHKSTSAATTFTFSNLAVDAPETLGPVTAEVSVGNTASCTGGTPCFLPGSPTYDASLSGVPEITIYTVATGFGPHSDGPIFGSTSEQTAVASLEYQRPVSPGGNCLPNNQTPRPSTHSVGSTVVLTVDSNDGFDSLAAAYLAGFYDTGVLLTEGGNDAPNANGGSNTNVDPYTLQAIQQEGVTSVLIVGGPAAISNADMTQLENTPSYFCGGATERTNANGGVQDLQVQRIWGNTADDTAEAVSTFVDSGAVGQLNFSGAFGQYNDTTGTSSAPSPNLSLRTAILATDLDSFDAESASALAYFEGLPMFLTPRDSLGSAAETGLLDLGIQQVVEVGGPLAISDSVNSALEAQGISVLRIAGIDQSDTSVQLAEFELNTSVNANGQPEGLDWAPFQGWHGFPNSSGGVSYGFGDNCAVNLNDATPGSTNPGQASNGTNVGLTAFGQHNAYAHASCQVTVALARGDFFADGVTSSDVTGHDGYPIILTENPSTLGSFATGFFNLGGSPTGVDPVPNALLGPTLPFKGEITDDILPFGGPLALNASTIAAALNAISAGANPS